MQISIENVLDIFTF